MDPSTFFSQYADVLQQKGYQHDANGWYRTDGPGTMAGVKDYFPPWALAQEIPDLPTAYKLTPDAQGSAWAGMAQGNGAFSHPAAWDSSRGTYSTSVDLPTLLGTIAAGGVIGSGIAAGVAGGTAGTGGTLASETIAPTMGALPAGVTSGALEGAAVEGGLLPSTALGSGLATLPAGAGGLAGAAGTGSTLAATPIGNGMTSLVSDNPAFDAEGNFIGDSTVTGGPGSTLGTIGQRLLQPNTLSTIGKALGSTAQAVGNNRLNNDLLTFEGQTAYEKELEARAQLEMEQRNQALKDAYRANFAQTYQPGPYDPVRTSPFTPQYMQTLGQIAQQGSARLAQAPQYGTNVMPALTPFKPSGMGPGETALNWASPLATIGGAILADGGWF